MHDDNMQQRRTMKRALQCKDTPCPGLRPSVHQSGGVRRTQFCGRALRHLSVECISSFRAPCSTPLLLLYRGVRHGQRGGAPPLEWPKCATAATASAPAPAQAATEEAAPQAFAAAQGTPQQRSPAVPAAIQPCRWLAESRRALPASCERVISQTRLPLPSSGNERYEGPASVTRSARTGGGALPKLDHHRARMRAADVAREPRALRERGTAPSRSTTALPAREESVSRSSVRHGTDDAPFNGTTTGARGAAHRAAAPTVGCPPKVAPGAATDAMPATRRRSHLTAALRRERLRREDAASPVLSTLHQHRGAAPITRSGLRRGAPPARALCARSPEARREGAAQSGGSAVATYVVRRQINLREKAKRKRSLLGLCAHCGAPPTVSGAACGAHCGAAALWLGRNSFQWRS